MDVPYGEGSLPEARLGPCRLLKNMLLASCGWDVQEAERRRREIDRRQRADQVRSAALLLDPGEETTGGPLAEMLLAWRDSIREETRREIAQLREELLGEMSRLLSQFAQKQGVRRG